MGDSQSRQKAVSKKRLAQPLSRKVIIDVAQQLAVDQGIDKLSMRKLANLLNVEAMSLYNHVANKEDLMDGMLEAVISQFELPEIGGNWKRAMKQRAVSAHTVLLQHSWAAELMISRISVLPARMIWSDVSIGCLREAGFSHTMTDHALNALDNHLYGFTLQIVNSPVNPEAYAQTAKQYLPRIPASKYPYLNAMAQTVIDGSHSGINDFEFGLDLILDGLERLLIMKE